MNVDKVNVSDARSIFKKERRKQSFLTGATVGVALQIAHDIFQRHEIAGRFNDFAKEAGKNKAFLKTAGVVGFGLASAAVVYGLINTVIGIVLDIIRNLNARH